MKKFNKGDVVWFYMPTCPKIYKGVVVQTSNGIEECLTIEYRKKWYGRKIKECGVPLDFVFDDESDALESIIIFRKRMVANYVERRNWCYAQRLQLREELSEHPEYLQVEREMLHAKIATYTMEIQKLNELKDALIFIKTEDLWKRYFA